MSGISHTTNVPHEGRHNRLLQEWVHDTYKSKHKLPEPTVCGECGAIYRNGRWQWGEAVKDAHRDTCPACHRIADNVPAGFVRLSGEFFDDHRDEVLALVRNVERREKADHPLKRIIGMDESADGLLIRLTDPHLARGVGEALHHAYKGDLDFDYQQEDPILRVSWKR